MLKILKKALMGAFFCVLLTAASDLLATAPTSAATECPSLASLRQSPLADRIQQGIVKWIADGDTLHTTSGAKLRLLHINAPELNAGKNQPPQPFAKAAQKQLAALAPVGSRIYWLYDQKKRDKYHRQLVFLYNQQGVFVNAHLVHSGLATSLFIPPNVQYWRCIRQAEDRARRSGQGIWSDTGFQPKPAAQIKARHGAQLVTGRITKLNESKRHLWIVLDNRLWVGIPKKDFANFSASELAFKTGERLILRGYVYQSHGKKRLKWHHPAQRYPSGG